MDPKDKKKRAQRFSKAAQTYDEYSEPQQAIGTRFAKLLKGQLQGKRILEIGCGTGFLSELLLSEHPSELVLCDLSEGMLNICRSRFKNCPEVKFIQADAECDFLGENYDAIVSNLAFQWFSSLEQGLINLKHSLKPGGTLCFSTFLRGNLQEIDEIAGVGISYLSYMEINALVKKVFAHAQLEPMPYVSHYPQVHAMLKALKATGVTSVTSSLIPWTRDKLKLFVDSYTKQFSDDDGVYLTWKGLLVWLHD